ncbi:MAG: chemotaxis protein CheW [Pseudomonadota bacterium]
MTDLTDDYIIEAREHLDEMETHLLQLDQAPDDVSILNNIFTDVHTIKGAAQFTGLSKSSELAHRVEDLLDLLRQGELTSNTEIIDLLIDSRDRLALLVNEIEQSRQEESEVDVLVEQLNQVIKNNEHDSIQKPKKNSDTEQNIVSENLDDESIDPDLLKEFLLQSKEQVELISTILAKFETEPDCKDYCHQLISAMIIIVGSATPLGLKKTIHLSEKILTLLVSVEKKNNLINQAILDLLQDVNERFTVLLNELEFFQLEATPVDDLIDLIEELIQKNTSKQLEIENNNTEINDKEVDTVILETFIDNTKTSLNAIESNLLLLENDTHNNNILTSLTSHLNNIQNTAQPLSLFPIETLCQHTISLLNSYINNDQVISLPLMELLSEIETQLLLSITELEDSGQVILPIEDLLENIQILSQLINEDNNDTKNNLDQNIVNFETPIIDLSGESYTEEYDQELFDIFLQQLQKTLQLLHEQVNEQKHLSVYSIAINSLKSSANYMGYNRLVEFYQQWLERIDFLIRSQNEDKIIIQKLMFDYIEQLVNTFPQLESLENNSITKEFKSEQSILETKASDENKMPSLPSDHYKENKNNDDKENIKDNLEDDLFTQLSQALESSTSHDIPDETMHKLFDDMLTDNEEATDILPYSSTEPSISIPKPKEEFKEKPKQQQNTNNLVQPKLDKDQQKQSLSKKKTSNKLKQTKQKNTTTNKKSLKRSVRVDANKIDTLMNQVGELIVDKGYFHQLFNELRLLQKELKENAGLSNRELKQIRAFSFRFAEAIVSFGRTSNDLQEGVMKVRMLPIAQLFDRYPRLVHDLVNKTNKKVNLEVRGEDTELDKMIIEEISDPLIHLIRNAVDHGIEGIEERRAAGKRETATLLLEAYNESNHIVIEISDDGRGIDPEKIKAKALEKSLYNEDELARMSHKEITHLIMLPGFSTAKEVSNTSGRGVGMDVVKKNIEKLNGILEIDSKPGVYTKMRLKIPLTLAIIRALQVRVGSSFFTIPLSNVEETLRVYAKDTSMMEGTKVIHLRGKTMPIIYLSKLFNIQSDYRSSEKFFVVTVNTGMQQIGLIVDELLGQAEVVIKPLVDYLQEKSGFSGATIIGDGKISLILDIYELINMTTNKQVLWHEQQALKRETQVLEENNR